MGEVMCVCVCVRACVRVCVCVCVCCRNYIRHILVLYLDYDIANLQGY